MHQRSSPGLIFSVQLRPSLDKQADGSVVEACTEDRRLSLIVLQIDIGSRRNKEFENAFQVRRGRRAGTYETRQSRVPVEIRVVWLRLLKVMVWEGLVLLTT